MDRAVRLWNDSSIAKNHTFSKSDIKELAISFKFRSFHALDHPISYGQDVNQFFFILKGVVSVIYPNPDIKNIILDSGMEFDEISLISDEPSVLTIKCLTNCYCVSFDKVDFKRVLNKANQRTE